MQTMRSLSGTRARAALRSVVLPEPVAPETRTLARAAHGWGQRAALLEVGDPEAPGPEHAQGEEGPGP